MCSINVYEDIKTIGINLNNIEVFKPSDRIRKTRTISLVSKNNCNRLTLSKRLINDLGNPKSVQVAFDNGILLIGEKIFDTDGLKLKDNNIIYNIELVEKITEFFDLDLSDKTSIAFETRELPPAYASLRGGGFLFHSLLLIF